MSMTKDSLIRRAVMLLLCELGKQLRYGGRRESLTSFYACSYNNNKLCRVNLCSVVSTVVVKSDKN